MIKLKDMLKEFWMPGPMQSAANRSPLSYASDGEDDDLRSYTESSIQQENNDWFISTGTNNWQDKKAYCSAYITESDGKPMRIWAEIKTKWLRKPTDTHSGHHERVRKTISKVSKAWASEAKRIRREEIVSEIGNRKTRPWKECFMKALKSPKVAPFIMESGIDNSTMDPVNFTPRF